MLLHGIIGIYDSVGTLVVSCSVICYSAETLQQEVIMSSLYNTGHLCFAKTVCHRPEQKKKREKKKNVISLSECTWFLKS